ncbi:hypothetical protein JCM8097_006357 [Rhodosporidiobolus ruineniae]
MSYALPTLSANDFAAHDPLIAFASSSHAPFQGAGSTGASGGMANDAARRAAANKGRRKGKGKGRMMMIKIFYALNSPRFGRSGATPSASSSAPTPSDFFAVLDPSLAPTPPPNASTPSGSSSALEVNYSCMARLSAPVWVQVINGKGGSDAQFGRVTLKTCLSAICISRPELVIDASKDFSVSAVDPYESSYQRQPPAGLGTSASSSSRPGEGFVEGKGMLSWTLAEKKEGTTMVCGKVTGGEAGDERRSKRRKADDGGILFGLDGEDEDSESGEESEETLEIWLQLTERDSFTQGQFLDCLRSYHNPVQQLQSEMSDFNSSPPKQHASSGPFASSSSSFPRSSAPVPDPVKRKRPREQPPLPIPPPAAAAPPVPFAPAPDAAIAANPALHDPRILALLTQLANPAAASTPNPALAALDTPQGQALLPALSTLAKFYGLELPSLAAAPTAPSQVPLPPSSMPPSSSAAGPSHSASARPPTDAPSTSTAAPEKGKPGRRKEREHFATIDPSTLTIPPQGKQNPRDPASGCSNCKRRKSTVWREGAGVDGKMTSVCNACGIFYNKNGYHRSKASDAKTAAIAATSTAPAPSSSGISSKPAAKAGRPLKGRLTATCEADLKKQSKTKRKLSSPSDRQHQPGIIPPLSPSKQIGPRSPALNFGFSHSARAGSRAHNGIMSSPGRSPRMRYRQSQSAFAATSPVRSANPGLGVSYESDGEERGPNPLSFPSLFGNLNGSPSPARVDNSRRAGGGSGEKGMPSYLLTASPGTALDRILNDTAFTSVFGSGGGNGGTAAEGMQVEQQGQATQQQAPTEGGFAGFDFFLGPGSPTLGKENSRPRRSPKTGDLTSMTTDGADVDSFESVLSSLRRDFSNRLSSNALTALSSPAPSSPCLLPRTSTATPGSKGKAPLSSGRPAPSIHDSSIDGLVPAFSLGSASNVVATGTTPESEGWSPQDGRDDDHTATLNSVAALARSGFDLGSLAAQSGAASNGHADAATNSKPSRRAAFIPAHLIAPSDAATEFDFGSLPPSSPPQLPSEAFPTPSDFDGITPSADGGDGDERERERPSTAHSQGLPGQSPLTIEAVAEKVASEPNEEARKAMLALLQSLGASGAAEGAAPVQLPGAGTEQVQLDRSTVNKLLALISANTASASSPSNPAPFLTGSSSTATGLTASASTSTIVAKASPAAASHQQQQNEQPDQPDLSALDIFGGAFDVDAVQQNAGAQVGDLYENLFGGGSGF